MNIEESAKQKILEYKSQLEKNNYLVSLIEKKQYNFEFTANKNSNKNKVQVFFGKKGVKTVIQGNKDSKEYLELENIITGNFNLFSEKKELSFTNYIGSDESGKGDYFGPLVIAAMYVDESIIPHLKELGVRDSKELSDFQINNIASVIRKEYPTHFSVLNLIPSIYNETYNKFFNLNKLLNWGHSKVVEELLSKFNSPAIITDEFSKTKLKIAENLKFADKQFIQLPKAESYIGVAAASIIARNELNIWFDNQLRDGYEIQKGASLQVQDLAKVLFNKVGNNKFKNFVKLHFKTTKKIFEDN